jgi:hypothetical protein
MEVSGVSKAWPGFLQAVKILQSRGFAQGEVQHLTRLITQLQAYNAGLPPFSLAVSADASFSVRAWWLAVGNAAAETVALALFLFDIVPHAGTTERTFSTMGWFDSPRRNRLHVASLAMMTSIRSNLLQQVPR